MLQAKHITISYGAKTVLKDVSLDFAAGSLTAIIGRNGCGKSTLLKAMSRSLIPQEGDVLLDGTSIFHQNTKKLAQRLAILSQGVRSPEDYTVRRLVCCGRYPYAGFGGRLSQKDFDAGGDALRRGAAARVDCHAAGPGTGGHAAGRTHHLFGHRLPV